MYRKLYGYSVDPMCVRKRVGLLQKELIFYKYIPCQRSSVDRSTLWVFSGHNVLQKISIVPNTFSELLQTKDLLLIFHILTAFYRSSIVLIKTKYICKFSVDKRLVSIGLLRNTTTGLLWIEDLYRYSVVLKSLRILYRPSHFKSL